MGKVGSDLCSIIFCFGSLVAISKHTSGLHRHFWQVYRKVYFGFLFAFVGIFKSNIVYELIYVNWPLHLFFVVSVCCR